MQSIYSETHRNAIPDFGLNCNGFVYPRSCRVHSAFKDVRSKPQDGLWISSKMVSDLMNIPTNIEGKKAGGGGSAACLLFAAVFCLSGCKAVPDYKPPQTQVSAQWSTTLSEGLSSSAIGKDTVERWWEVFNDPILADLIKEAVGGNLDLKQAEARVRQARAQRGISNASLFPALGVNAGASRSRSSKEAGSGSTSVFYSTGLDASWELDFFGGKRRALESSTASLQASEESMRDLQLTLLSEVALNYVEVRSYQELLTITESSVAIRGDTYNLARWRREAGLTTQLDVDQAHLSLEQARSQVPSLRVNLEQAKNRLAVLLGKAPGALNETLSKPGRVPTAPEDVAVGMPADLLRRRPDIRMAERQLAAYTAQIGVAKAQLYPGFSLSGTLGLEALEFANLYTASARAAQGMAKAAWTLFDGGAIRQNIKVKTARQEEALSYYEATILTALRDVENALVAYANEQIRAETLADAVKSGQSAFSLARDQYSSGLVNFQTVLDTQQALLAAQDELAISQARVTSNLISLYKNLGGGWVSAEGTSNNSNDTTSQNDL